MKAKKVLILSLLLVIALVSIVVALNSSVPQEYQQNQMFFLPFPLDQNVLLGDLFEMRRGIIFMWMSEQSGPTNRYFIFINSCLNIPIKLTSSHHSAIAQTDVIVCNVWGLCIFVFVFCCLFTTTLYLNQKSA